MDAHKNFAWSTVATAPSPATSGTSLVVASGEGAAFPAVPFNATVCPAGTQPTAANAEIIRVTARSTDTFSTIVRAQEGTGARTVVVGDQIFAAVTALTLTDIEVAGWSAVAGSGLIDRQVFTATGAFTWTKPAGARMVRVRLVGAGGGGSSGRRGAAGTARVGGGGGAGGAYIDTWFVASELGPTVAGVVGTGGAGGAAVTVDDTSGNAGGVTSGATDFGTYLKANGAAIAPTGGGAGAGGAGGVSGVAASAGGTSGGGAASATGASGGAGTLHEALLACPGGSAGGGITTGDVEAAGVLGRSLKLAQSALTQTGGTVPGGNATVVASPFTLAGLLYAVFPSYGGASGAASKTTAAGTGGAGQGYGAGGGGGGASLNGFNSGAGGAGAPGLAIVETFG